MKTKFHRFNSILDLPWILNRKNIKSHKFSAWLAFVFKKNWLHDHQKTVWRNAFFVNLALKIQCHILSKMHSLQRAFSASLPTGQCLNISCNEKRAYVQLIWQMFDFEHPTCFDQSKHKYHHHLVSPLRSSTHCHLLHGYVTASHKVCSIERWELVFQSRCIG